MEGGPAREAIDLGDRAKMESCVREIFALREAGDIAGMAQLVTDDIVVFPPTTWGYATFPRTIAGRMAVAEAFTHRNVQYENLGSTIRKLLIDGEWAVVHRTSTIRERGGSRQYTYDAVDFFRFRDGLVCEFSEFPDGTLKDATENFPLRGAAPPTAGLTASSRCCIRHP
jgi:ketosteroid isomerase-like protein